MVFGVLNCVARRPCLVFAPSSAARLSVRVPVHVCPMVFWCARTFCAKSSAGAPSIRRKWADRPWPGRPGQDMEVKMRVFKKSSLDVPPPQPPSGAAWAASSGGGKGGGERKGVADEGAAEMAVDDDEEL